jgi:hypothetical protein
MLSAVLLAIVIVDKFLLPLINVLSVFDNVLTVFDFTGVFATVDIWTYAGEGF